MLLEKTPPHFLTRLFVWIYAGIFLFIGGLIFVLNMVQFALSDHGSMENVFIAIALLLSATFLIRLRSQGLWILLLLVIYLYAQMMIWQENAADQPQFFFNFLLLLALCLLFPTYFALRRSEGRKSARFMYFLVFALYIALTSLSLAAYYDDAFCTYKQMMEMPSHSIGSSLYVSLNPSFSQWLALVPCHLDGNLFFE